VRQVLHLVRRRPGGAPMPALRATDWRVDVDGAALTLRDCGAPPLPPGPLDATGLLILIRAAALVITW
jgi:hypothetical protein